MGGSRAPYADVASTFQAFERHVSPGKARLFRALELELVMGKREGVYFEDAFSGARYLNAHCNGGVYNLGHRHPELLAAFR